MATFAKLGFKALNYNSFRPRYPPSFYSILAEYVKQSGDRSISSLDIGCGTGIATYDLLNISDSVEGIDHSVPMVNACNDVKASRLQELGVSDLSRINFSVGDLDHLPQGKTYDLVTAAQCLHWCKDYDSFFQRAHSILNPGGVLAYWFYVDPIITDYKGHSNFGKQETLQKAKQMYFKYAYDDPKYFGPHWEQPGRTIIKEYYKDIDNQIPKGMFSDIKSKSYIPEFTNFVAPSEENDLVLQKNCTMRDMQKYLSTYSAYHNFLGENKDTTFLEDYVNDFYSTFGWSDSTEITLVWNTGYTFLRK